VDYSVLSYQVTTSKMQIPLQLCVVTIL